MRVLDREHLELLRVSEIQRRINTAMIYCGLERPQLLLVNVYT